MVLALLVIGYLFAAPYLTAYRIKLAADDGDSERVARFVDFESVRASLRPQVQGRVASETEGLSGDEDVDAALGVLGAAAADQAVDRYVTAEGIAALMRGEGDPDPAVAERLEEVAVAAGYRSPSRFAVVLTDAESGHDVELILTRAGLGWQVTEVLLPDG